MHPKSPKTPPPHHTHTHTHTLAGPHAHAHLLRVPRRLLGAAAAPGHARQAGVVVQPDHEAEGRLLVDVIAAAVAGRGDALLVGHGAAHRGVQDEAVRITAAHKALEAGCKAGQDAVRGRG